MKGELGNLRVFVFPVILLLFLLTDARVSAGTVEDRIKALEEAQRANAEELSRLKGEQEQAKTEQMDLKKEALAARDALPTFRYRPSRGLMITSADRTWGFGVTIRHYTHIFNHPEGQPIITNTEGERDNTGMHSGQLFTRRNRIKFTFCVSDCFHEIEFGLTVEDDPVEPRDMEWHIHFDKLNPYLPEFTIGTRIGGRQYRGRSSRTGFKVEHNIIQSNNSTTSTGSSNGIALTWEDVPFLTGDVLFQYRYLGNGIGFTVDEKRDTDKKSHSLGFEIRPFRETKIKWLRGLLLNTAWQFQPIDKRENSLDEDSPNRLRLRTHDRNGRLVVFDTGGGDEGIGGGLHYNGSVSARYTVGPYFLRAAFFPKDHWRDEDNASFGGPNLGGVDGRGFEITNGLFLWSPKGFLTGRARTPGTVQLGFTFERADASCGKGADCNPDGAAPTVGNDFNNNTLLVREVSLFYWVVPQLRLGIWWDWYESKNTPRDVQAATGCSGSVVGANPGKECDWHTISLGWQANW